MSIRHLDVECIACMPDTDRFLGGLDVVSHYRNGGTVFFIFRQGGYSVAVTAKVTTVGSRDGAPWFMVVRPPDPLARDPIHDRMPTLGLGDALLIIRFRTTETMISGFIPYPTRVPHRRLEE